MQLISIMYKTKEIFDEIINAVKASEASNAAVISTESIQTDISFRDMCERNACGLYGKCWMCPPDVGDIYELIKDIERFEYALVFNQISSIEDSFDFEGMMEARKRQPQLIKKIRGVFEKLGIKDNMILGAGGCGICEVCSKIKNEPCRFPSQAFASLEAYGINVSKLGEAAGLNYINGRNTVTYFGVVLFNI